MRQTGNTALPGRRRGKRGRHLVGVALAAAAAVAVPVTSGTASAVAVDATPAKEPTQAQWRQLDRVARAHHALGVDGLTDTVLTLPAGTSAREKARVEAEIPAGMKVTVKVSALTRTEVDKVQKAVMAGDWSAKSSTYGIAAAYDARQDKVVVNLEAPKAAGEALERTYPKAVDVQPGRFTPEADWRFGDESPFWGGAAINGDLNCTAGWAIRSKATGDHYMVTAAHCNKHLTHVRTPQGFWFGQVTRVRQDLDAETIGGKDYGGHIWTGGTPGSRSALAVTNWSGWTYLGRKLCVSGRTTYNHCGHPVVENAVPMTYNWFGQRAFVSADNVYLMDRGGTDPCHCNGKFTAPGDSGAPVYEPGWPEGTAVITGIHHGAMFRNGANRMVNIKPGSILQAFNADMVQSR